MKYEILAFRSQNQLFDFLCLLNDPVPPPLPLLPRRVWFNKACDYDNVFQLLDQCVSVSEISLSYDLFRKLFLLECRVYPAALKWNAQRPPSHAARRRRIITPTVASLIAHIAAPNRLLFVNLTHLAVGMPNVGASLAAGAKVVPVDILKDNRVCSILLDHLLRDRRICVLSCTNFSKTWELGMESIWERTPGVTVEIGRRLLCNLKFEAMIRSKLKSICRRLFRCLSLLVHFDTPVAGSLTQTPASMVERIWIKPDTILDEIADFPKFLARLPNLTGLSVGLRRFEEICTTVLPFPGLRLPARAIRRALQRQRSSMTTQWSRGYSAPHTCSACDNISLFQTWKDCHIDILNRKQGVLLLESLCQRR
ncbi:hypothetical protein C8J56DRAFT_1053834 [Mycena floridula]|nr:hypothetical protein C8J56DRAFT_1053834 [Mycena floridula]